MLNQCVTLDVMQSALLSEKQSLRKELLNSGPVHPGISQEEPPEIPTKQLSQMKSLLESLVNETSQLSETGQFGGHVSEPETTNGNNLSNIREFRFTQRKDTQSEDRFASTTSSVETDSKIKLLFQRYEQLQEGV